MSFRLSWKLRSNAGKKIRIRNGSFALDSQQSITLEGSNRDGVFHVVKIHPKVVDELLKGYMESKTFESLLCSAEITCRYRLQFIITGISDLLYDRISTADEEAQSALLAKQVGDGDWEPRVVGGDVQVGHATNYPSRHLFHKCRGAAYTRRASRDGER